MTEEEKQTQTPDQYLSSALNWLDSWMGKYWREFKFEIIEAKEMVKLGAKCRACPKEIEVRLWYKHDEWPQMIVKDFIGETVLHAKIHAPKIILPKAGMMTYWKGKK
jgi:hypothetical protein